MAKCGSCACDIAGNSRFCPSCGKAVEVDSFATRTVAATPRESSKSSGSDSAGVLRSSSSSRSESRFPPGTLLAGRYRIVSLLGKGGMGEVYRADDFTLEQPVALKFLPEGVADNPAALGRFKSEVRIARQVSHPNVCRVYDVGEMDGQVFLSMEYVDGEDLASLLRRIGRLPADKGLEIARKLCAGLSAAHEKGVLHRDLKPGNIMLDGRGQVLLTDFGLAGLADELTGAEVRNGTPAYMAPEQLAGKEVTARSDIYSLGLVLYEVFTGKRPFEAGTLAELVRAQTETTPTSLTTLVRDLDPVVERVILRCLDPDPAGRPASALTVAMALPGGDPLAAAIAAGETPSPQMVAAAGEGAGLTPRVAILLLAAIVGGAVLAFMLGAQRSVLARIRPEFSSEVLSQKAKEIIRHLGYPGQPEDDAGGFNWNDSFYNYVSTNDKPNPKWSEALRQRTPLLRFWYRTSDYPLTAGEFHDDMLTPGIVTTDDPAPIRSGMIQVELDSQGRLLYFEAIPPQKLDPVKETPGVDWKSLFAAADLDLARFQPTEPLWTWLATSDTRSAWTGKWPGTERPLRIEAAALRGKPVAFSLIGPWTKPERMPERSSSAKDSFRLAFIIGLALVVFIGTGLLGRRNRKKGQGDRQGATRLAWFMFVVQMAIWGFRTHFSASFGTFGSFLLAICTSIFYAFVTYAMYIALEPFVRRRWPQAIISWSSVLTGHIQDPVVGRDVLFGIALAVGWRAMEGVGDFLAGNSAPVLDSTATLQGIRSTFSVVAILVPGSIRAMLVFFFVLFLLRIVLRNEWAAVVAFALIFAARHYLGYTQYVLLNTVEAFIIYASAAIAVVRLGLLVLVVALFVADLLPHIPHATPSAWYFGDGVLLAAIPFALAVWACYTSMKGHQIWKTDLLES
jgi:predicted Ser/Thr protein kinase